MMEGGEYLCFWPQRHNGTIDVLIIKCGFFVSLEGTPHVHTHVSGSQSPAAMATLVSACLLLSAPLACPVAACHPVSSTMRQAAQRAPGKSLAAQQRQGAPPAQRRSAG